MNRNKIVDFSNQFAKCSLKIISNELLLNNFMMLLFPKTCLYEIYCVLKCLDLIGSYFESLVKANKKLPYFFSEESCRAVTKPISNKKRANKPLKVSKNKEHIRRTAPLK